MPSISNSIDRLIDALAGDDIAMTSPTIAGRIEQLADAIEDGDITIGGGGGLIRCSVTKTGTGAENDPKVGHITNAAKLLEMLDQETDNDSLVVFGFFDNGVSLPAAAAHETFVQNEQEVIVDSIYGYLPDVQGALSIQIVHIGDTVTVTIDDKINDIQSSAYTVADDVLSYTDSSQH